MQMEESMKPVVHLLKNKPPSEPPPSQETITPHIEETQWIGDVKNAAALSLSQRDTHNATALCDTTYTPSIKKLSSDRAITACQLSLQRKVNAKRTKIPQRCTLNPPTRYVMHIPTPKAQLYTEDVIHNTTWKDDPTRHWTAGGLQAWNIPPPTDTEYTHTTPLCITPYINTTLPHPIPLQTPVAPDNSSVKMAHPHALPLENIPFTIRTEPVQSDTGANQNVTSIKSMIHNFEEIEPYPIGGVKANEVAIVCTGRGQFPWVSKEGVVTMADILFSAEVEGTIVSPTTVCTQHKDKYEGFNISTNIDTGI